MQRKSKVNSRRNRKGHGHKARDTRPLKLEALENREMFAADLVYSTGPDNLLTDDLRLQAVQNGGNLSVRLMRGATEVAIAPLDDAGDVTINVKRNETTAGDLDPFSDTLRIDLNSLNLLNTFVVNNGGVLTVNFEGGVADPFAVVAAGDQLLLESNGTSNIGYGLSVITTADITLSAVSATFNGNLLLRSNPNSTSSGTTLDLATVLALPSAMITVNGGSITANNITLEADAEKSLIVTADSDIPVAEVIVNASANINIQNSAVITATGSLTILAESNMTTNVGRAPVDDGDATDDDAEEDAAVAVSVINNVTNVTINSGATLSSNGATLITSNNLVTATSIADGMLGNDAAGGTVAMTTVSGDTTLLVDGATITAGGNLTLLSNSIRSATTQAIATPGGTKDDDDSTTTTRGETELEAADAETSEGSVDFAAAIAIGNLTGNTKAEINNATVKSTTGNVTHQAKAKHTVVTKADGSTTSNESESGIGVAVAIQNTNAEALARILGNSSIDGNNVFVDARHDNSSVTIDSLSGATGTSSSDDVGFAGSLAIGVTVVNSRAKIEDGASVNANGANLILNSDSKTTTIVRGLPHENGVSLGVGASFALNIVDQTTQATVGDGAVLNNLGALSLTATSDHTKTTETRTGAAGGLAFAGALSILVDNDDTLATLGTGAVTNVSGNLTLLADSKTQTTTKAQGMPKVVRMPALVPPLVWLTRTWSPMPAPIAIWTSLAT